ncbi:glutamine-rich protein 2 isoform X2 [Struthio camelus]|uniref:glutamine-rich protein 2 isoform X2 n=1 Tax=Struthio camelus TaxID=8801 RepID=UPI003603E413
MAPISLYELADLAIGTPEVGAVNFNALHSLLHAILQHLNLQDVKTEVREESLEPPPAPAPPLQRAQLLEREKALCATLEKKVNGVEVQLQGMGQQLQELEKQMATLETLPSGMDLLERTKSSSQTTSVVADMWQMMQMKKKIEANESGVSKAMALFQDLLTEMSRVKAIQLHMEEDIQRIKELLGLVTPRDAASQPPGLLRDQARPDRDMEAKTGRSFPGKPPSAAAEASGIQPSPREGTLGTQPDSLGTRAGMPGAPATRTGPPVARTRASDTSASSLGAQPGSLGTGAITAGAQPGSPGPGATITGAQPGSPGTGTTVTGAQPGSPGTGATTTAGAQPGSPGTGTTVTGAQPRSPGTGATVSGTQPGSPGAGTTVTGAQPGSPGTGTTVTGAQPGSPGTGATTTAGAQPGSPGTGTTTTAGAQPGSPGTGATTTAGAQPGSPGTGTTITGAQPGSPGTGTTTTAGAQPGSPGTGTTITGAQPGSPGTGATTTAGAQPGSPGTGTTVTGAQPGSPGTGATTTAGAQPGSPGTGTTITGAQPGSPGTGTTTTAGAQPGSPGTGTTVTGAQPGSPGTGTTITAGAQPGSPGTGTTVTGAQPGSLGTGATVSGTQPGSPGAGTTVTGTQPGSPGTGTTITGAQPGSPGTGATTTAGAQPGSLGTGATVSGTQPGSPGTGATVTGTQPAPPGVQAGGARVQPRPLGSRPSLSDTQMAPPEARLSAPGARTDAPSLEGGREALSSRQGAPAGSPAVQRGPLTADSTATAHQPEIPSGTDTRPTSSLQERTTPAMPWESSGSPSASSHHAELGEALHQVGQLSSLYAALKEQVAQLELTKCDRAELEKLRPLFLEADQKSSPSILGDLLDQVASLQTVANDLQGEKAKIKQLQNVIERMAVAGADQKAESTNQINLQLGYLRSMVQEIEKELKELREKQDGAKAKLEQSVTDVADHLQEQLDKLRSVMENMMASSSALLSMSMPASPELRQAEAQATCPACSLDVSEQVKQLFQRYEQLQHLVNSFVARQAEIKAVRQLPARSQDEELLKHIQATILQVQEDCEKLNSVTGDLVDDHRQKQKDIEALFQSLEKLEKEKADKEDLVTEINVKADKAALAGKVSRIQFDATMEHLNKMIQDMLDRITGQEQDWHQIQQKLIEEMDSKLDRLELTPFRQRLEERWKSLLKQLQEKAPRMEADDAAGIRKQLLAHFHCVSCDRSLNMLVPGPHILAIPSMPALPSRHSVRPHTVFELEQIRQHGRSLRSGPAGPHSPLDALLLDRGAQSLRCAHDQMARDIEKVQLHYGGSTRASSQMIRDLLQLPCLGPAHRRERAAECGYLTVPRHCGGRHTLTHPLQRLARCVPGQLEPSAVLTLMKHDEMELLGQDGHIYKGRRATRLPAIAGKDGSPKKTKLSGASSRRPWAAPDAGPLPSRPQSASSPRSPPGTARSAECRPASSRGPPRHAPGTPQPQEEARDAPAGERDGGPPAEIPAEAPSGRAAGPEAEQ